MIHTLSPMSIPSVHSAIVNPICAPHSVPQHAAIPPDVHSTIVNPTCAPHSVSQHAAILADDSKPAATDLSSVSSGGDSEVTAIGTDTTGNGLSKLSDRDKIAGTDGTTAIDSLAVDAASNKEDPYPRVTPNLTPKYLISQDTTECNKEVAVKHDPHPRSDAFLGYKLTLENDIELKLEEVIYRPCIRGRGNTVLRARCTPKLKKKWNHHNDEVIVKVSFPDEGREAEDGVCAKALNTASELGDDHSWVKNHLPNNLYSKTYNHVDNMLQSQIRKFLKWRRMDFAYENPFETRTRCIIIVQEVLSPITELTSWVEFVKVFTDVLQVHRWLVDHPKILHRDLSEGNIMFRRTDKMVYGVLNDFDSSSYLPASGNPSSRQRTGTKAFMSPELLDKAWISCQLVSCHLYRHDLEALIYVILVFCCHYDMYEEESSGVSLMEECPFIKWSTHGTQLVRAMKFELFSGLPDTIPVTKFFKPFEPCLRTLLARLSRGYNRKAVYKSDLYFATGDPPTLDGKILTFDWDTLDNNVTYEIVLQALVDIGGDAVEVVYPEPLALKREDFELPLKEDVTMEN